MPASSIFVAVLVDDGRVVLAELLADRLQLAAQDVLALLLLGAGLDVLADALADLHLGQALALDAERELEPLADVEVSSSSTFCSNDDVGRVAGRVGERAGLGDRADECRDAAVVAAQLEDLLDDGAVLALELADAAVRHFSGSGCSSTSTRSVPSGSVWAAPATPRWRPVRVTALPPPGSRTRSATSATVPTSGVLALVARDEQHALLVADVDGQRDGHVREDDDVFERNEQKCESRS